ncbi:zf-RING 2 domain containing protein [Trichuris trichiura]|uniref:Zf-RING 2 domain containing protein n=1 Tax=Trichuris trichiura TaxID=36087 RepID=A0A077ZBM5_TRITR|nr:zf-RING 2 domain containing protein [Trichuris trichiura]
MRACELLTSGLDKTLHDHVAVVIMDGIVQPFMAGCVSPYNQVCIWSCLDILSSSVFDKGILPALMLLLFFIVPIELQVKAQNRRRSDFPVRILAEAALTRMELKKFSHTRKMKRPPLGEPNTATVGLLSDSSLSLCGSDLCAICLEVYKDGQTLRVISCGHEFHRKCVDPWLLANHTCPLCLFDVVLEKHVPSRQEPTAEPVESAMSPWPSTDQRTPNATLSIHGRRSIESPVSLAAKQAQTIANINWSSSHSYVTAGTYANFVTF